MKGMLLGLTAAALCAGPSANAATIIDFGSITGNLGLTQNYTVLSTYTVTASGFSSDGNATALYGKNEGPGEAGLGLANDTSGEHEIEFGHGYVQLNVSALFGHVTNVDFIMGSTTDGEEWEVYASNTAGHCGAATGAGTGYSSAAGNCGTQAAGTFLTGNDQGTYALPDFGTYSYYDFVEISRTDNSLCDGHPCSDTSDNVLLAALTGTASRSVPEPITLSLFGAGLAGAVALRRRRKAKD